MPLEGKPESEEYDYIICVECGEKQDPEGRRASDEVECPACGYTGPGYMFDAHEILEE